MAAQVATKSILAINLTIVTLIWLSSTEEVMYCKHIITIATAHDVILFVAECMRRIFC